MAATSLPASFSPSLSWARQNMPTTPGVYIYKNHDGRVIYIGKAKNLKRRVESYFRSPVSLGPKTAKLVSQIASLEYIEVSSEIESLLLESRLIKKFRPRFNIAAKDDTSPYYIHLTPEEYPRPIINHLSKGSLVGPFLNGLMPKRILRQFRHIAPFCLAKRPVTKPCFYSHLGLCHPCPGLGQTPQIKKQYQKNISLLRQLFKSKFRQVNTLMEKQMTLASKNQNYEAAAIFRDKLESLKSLLSMPQSPDDYIANPNLISDKRQSALNSLVLLLSSKHLSVSNNLFRIEMYDIAHLQGDSASASMVVAQNGQLQHRLYRHFNIKFSPTNSDVDMMREVLTRRLNRNDWPVPDLIVIDGGKAQLSILKHITPLPPLKLRGGTEEGDIGIIVISLAKQFETIIIPVSDGYSEINLPKNDPGLLLLQSLRDEAHRFSRRLHHLRRSKNLLKG